MISMVMKSERDLELLTYSLGSPADHGLVLVRNSQGIWLSRVLGLGHLLVNRRNRQYLVNRCSILVT